MFEVLFYLSLRATMKPRRDRYQTHAIDDIMIECLEIGYLHAPQGHVSRDCRALCHGQSVWFD